MSQASTLAIARGATTFVFGSAIAATLSWGFASQGMYVDLPADDKPVNAPSFETHAGIAREVCGGPVVEMAPIASHVVVVRMNGDVVRMSVDEAYDRNTSKTHADNVWVVGVCTSDTQEG